MPLIKIFYCLLLVAYITTTAAHFPNLTTSLAPMLEQVAPAVVNISTETDPKQSINNNDPVFQFFFQKKSLTPLKNLGSGVIIDKTQGYVITNAHVIATANKINVTLSDGRQFIAKRIGADTETDIAVIQIQAPKLTAISLADSEKLRVGDFVVAIGNPFGLGQTVTSGIISALRRTGLGIEGYEDFIQTDAAINPGNSGGALVNLQGKLIGINTAILASQGKNVGIGFAIPSNLISTILKHLIQYGQVQRGTLGIRIQVLAKSNTQPYPGVVVLQIQANSPAEQAGLKVGDIINKINQRPIHNLQHVHTAIGPRIIGETISLEIIRYGQTQVLQLHITH